MKAVIVTLTAPAWTRRYADRPVNIDGDTSGLPSFVDALLYSISTLVEEVDVLSVTRAEMKTAQLRLALHADETGAQIESMFGHFAASLADIDIYDDDGPWALRQRLVSRGAVSGLDLDDEGLSVRLTVEASNPAVGAGVGDASRDMGEFYGGQHTPDGVILGSTVGFPVLAGRQWPTIVGAVYRVPAHRMGYFETPPDTGFSLALCGHHIADTSQAYVVRGTDGAPYTTVGTIEMVNDYDPDGGAICFLRSSDTEDFEIADSPFTIDLPGGGAGLDGGTAAITGGDVIHWLLAASGVAIDWPRCEPALRAVDGYKIGVYIDDETDALKLLRDRVLAVLPLIEEIGPAGIWLRWVDHRSLPIVAHLEEGVHLIGWTGPLSQDSDPDDIRNRFVANYNYDHDSGAYLSRVVIDRESHPGCAASYTLYGERLAEDLDIDITWDAATAARILAIRADQLSMVRYTRDGILDASMDALQAGDVVTVTSSRMGWTTRRCLLRTVGLVTDGHIPCTIEPLPLRAP